MDGILVAKPSATQTRESPRPARDSMYFGLLAVLFIVTSVSFCFVLSHKTKQQAVPFDGRAAACAQDRTPKNPSFQTRFGGFFVLALSKHKPQTILPADISAEISN
jgi:hypothetical protein